MNAPKRPQDRKPKAVKPKAKASNLVVTEVEGGKQVEFPDLLTADGEPLRVTVLMEALDDFELLEELNAIQVKKNAAMIPSVFRRFVGDDYDAVMDALRGDNGRVRIKAAESFLNDLMGALNPKS